MMKTQKHKNTKTQKQKKTKKHTLKNKKENNNLINVFTEVYETNKWGDNENPNYEGSSGLGSAIWYNKKTYIHNITFLIFLKLFRLLVWFSSSFYYFYGFRRDTFRINSLNLLFHFF